MIKILLFSWNKIKYPTHHNQIFSEQYNWKLTTGKTYFTFSHDYGLVQSRFSSSDLNKFMKEIIKFSAKHKHASQ